MDGGDGGLARRWWRMVVRETSPMPGMSPGAIGGSGSPPDAPMSSGDPSHRVRRRSSDLFLATSAGAAGQAHRPTPVSEGKGSGGRELGGQRARAWQVHL